MRIGIVGTGSMGTNHLRVVDSIPELNLTCAMDINQQHLDSACSGYQLKKLTNYSDMLENVDAVMVSTPTETHHSIAKFFIENKKNVIIEKPITISLAEADELINLSHKKNTVLTVGHLERFNPAVEYIKNLVENPLFIEIQRLGPFSPRSLDIDVIMDLMIHDIDIILQWEKTRINQINASGIPVISDKIDIANARLEFESGLVANITASRVSQKKTRKLRIFQKNNYFSVDYKKKRVKAYKIVNGEIIEKIPEIKPVEPLQNLWINFYTSVKYKENSVISPVEARNALALAIKISEKIEKNIVI